MFEGQEELSFKSTASKLSKATAAKFESAEGIESVFMEGDNFGLFENGMGEIPQSLDDLVNFLGIKDTTGTAESFDTQHFSAFASEDMWPI